MVEKKQSSGLLGKLKDKLDRMLGRKHSESLDISIATKKDTPSARRAYRIEVDNMHIICRTPRVKCRIADISATGVGFISTKEFPVGATIEAVMLWSGKPVIKGLKMKIMRKSDNIVGCEFTDLERGQDKIISKIVLAAQKRLIQKKHSGNQTDTTDTEVKQEAEKTMKRGVSTKGTTKIKL
ncbi:PilZ domain-containing protein [Maridesulfovibrio sp. FT414]|uniref:PilZ domain-containing protein n=1 Tax=Maridesulfovibrio sp. FT414 TaxID=2979469 RepID=UPI003D808684